MIRLALILLAASVAHASDYDNALAAWLHVEPIIPQVVWVADKPALDALHLDVYGAQNSWCCRNGVIYAFHCRGEKALMQHESFHALVRIRLPGVPTWLNEGTATLMETAVVVDGGLKFGHNTKRLRIAGRSDTPIQDILNYTQENTVSGDVSLTYANAYSVCEWLRRSDNLMRWLHGDGYTLNEDAYRAFVTTPGEW